MVAITLFIPNIFSRFCNARQIDCKLAKLVYIGWKMYKLAFHDHYSNNCSFRAKMTKRNGIKLTDRVLCRRRSTAIQSSCCLLILSQIYWKVVSLLRMLRLFTPFSLPQKRQRILFDFLPQELMQQSAENTVSANMSHENYPRITSELNEIRAYTGFLTVISLE